MRLRRRQRRTPTLVGWLGLAGFVASIARLGVDVWRHERKRMRKRAKKAAKQARRAARDSRPLKHAVH